MVLLHECVIMQADVAAGLSKAREERDFLRTLNETLLANQKDYQVRLEAAAKREEARDATIQDLQEQVRDLMVYIEAQKTIADAEASGQGELREATLLPAPAPASSGGRARSRAQGRGGHVGR